MTEQDFYAATRAREVSHRQQVAGRIVRDLLDETAPLMRERGSKARPQDIVTRLEHAARRLDRLGVDPEDVR